VDGKDGWTARFVLQNAFERDPAPFSDCENLVLFVDEAGRFRDLRTLVDSLQGRGAVRTDVPQRIKLVLSDWSRYEREMEQDLAKSMQRWRLKEFPIAPDEIDNYAEFIEKRFALSDPEDIKQVAKVSEGDPQVALKASEYVKDGRDLSALSRDQFMNGVLDDWRQMVQAGVPERDLALETMDIIALLDRFHEETMLRPIARFLTGSERTVRSAVRETYALVKGDLQREESEQPVYRIRPDIWRLHWLKTRFFGENPPCSLSDYIPDLLPLYPEGVVSGLVGVAEDSAFRSQCVDTARELLVPALYRTVQGTALLESFAELLLAFEQDELANDAIDLERMRNAREDGLAQGQWPGAARAATAFAIRGMPSEAVEWFSACNEKVGKPGNAPLVNNWGAALLRAAGLEREAGNLEQAQRLLVVFFRAPALSLTSARRRRRWAGQARPRRTSPANRRAALAPHGELPRSKAGARTPWVHLFRGICPVCSTGRPRNGRRRFRRASAAPRAHPPLRPVSGPCGVPRGRGCGPLRSPGRTPPGTACRARAR